ncbi:hypothetical protein QUA81_07350 [Microcoleus sp. F6_B4]
MAIFRKDDRPFFQKCDRPIVITYGMRPNFLRKSRNFFLKRAIASTIALFAKSPASKAIFP